MSKPSPERTPGKRTSIDQYSAKEQAKLIATLSGVIDEIDSDLLHGTVAAAITALQPHLERRADLHRDLSRTGPQGQAATDGAFERAAKIKSAISLLQLAPDQDATVESWLAHIRTL